MNQEDQHNFHPFKSQKAKEMFLTYYDERVKEWPVDSETMYVNTSFGQTFVRICGSKNGPSLVLLPGDSVTMLDWIPLIENLSKDYCIYALDQIYDIGRSIYSRPIKKPEDFTRWLNEVFIALNLDNINLMGYSYGGWQASLYALSHPERLNKVILLAPATALPTRLRAIIRVILYAVIPVQFMVKNYIYWFMADSVRKNEETKKIIDEMITETMLAKKCFKSRKFVNPTVLTDDDWQNLDVPILFLTGENEVLYSAKKAIQNLKNLTPNIKTAITSDAGHDLHIVKPDWVTTQVLKFLKE
ncbi:MAG: alpha/beta fold hydrolase [Candidatus Hodarchaeales archaeon]|jgi:pimeloyl-ACP methyl ester carboxylesterase